MSRTGQLWTTPLRKEPGTTRSFCIDCTKRLVVGTETLTGTPTVTASPSGLTLSAKAVNSSTFTEPDTGNTVASGQGVLVTIADGKSGDEYTLTTTVSITGGASGQQLELKTRVSID